jgi:hypothetical protein
LPCAINQAGDCPHRLVEFYPLAVDHGRGEAIVALAVRRIGTQCIERLVRLAGDVGMVGRILVAELVSIGSIRISGVAGTDGGIGGNLRG